MTARRLSTFIDALVAGRRPASFPADPDEAAMVRMAIELRAARPGEAKPDDEFVAALRDQLASLADAPVVPIEVAARPHRRRAVIAAIAAAAVLIAGTVTATEVLDRPAATTAALAAPHGRDLRTATFETPGHRVAGQIVVYRGNPSWVYMRLGGSTYNGPIVCMLRSGSGATVAVGHFDVHDGSATFSRSIPDPGSHIHRATLLTLNGDVVASARFG